MQDRRNHELMLAESQRRIKWAEWALMGWAGIAVVVLVGMGMVITGIWRIG